MDIASQRDQQADVGGEDRGREIAHPHGSGPDVGERHAVVMPCEQTARGLGQDSIQLAKQRLLFTTGDPAKSGMQVRKRIPSRP